MGTEIHSATGVAQWFSPSTVGYYLHQGDLHVLLVSGQCPFTLRS